MGWFIIGGQRIDTMAVVHKLLEEDYRIWSDGKQGFCLAKTVAGKTKKRYIDRALDPEIEKLIGAELPDNPGDKTKTVTEEGKKPTDADAITQELKSFQLLDEGSTGVDLMTDLGLTYEKTKTVLEHYKEIKDRETILEVTSERYVQAWFILSRHIGSVVRDGCESYNDSSGTCRLWDLRDIDPDFRGKYPGVIKTVNKRPRLKVTEHPEICGVCRRGRW